jgi:hypothetical protein
VEAQKKHTSTRSHLGKHQISCGGRNVDCPDKDARRLAKSAERVIVGLPSVEKDLAYHLVVGLVSEYLTQVASDDPVHLGLEAYDTTGESARYPIAHQRWHMLSDP